MEIPKKVARGRKWIALWLFADSSKYKAQCVCDPLAALQHAALKRLSQPQVLEIPRSFLDFKTLHISTIKSYSTNVFGI